MKDNEALNIIADALADKKAVDVKIINIKDLTSLANYFVIAEGTSTTQVKALADEVEMKMGLAGERVRHIEGYGSANQGVSAWVVLDYIDVVVHIFGSEARKFYDLERLWQDGVVVESS